MMVQVLAEAAAIDASKAAGNDTGPLCGLPFAVKDNIDVVGYATVAGTPALEGETSSSSLTSTCTALSMQHVCAELHSVAVTVVRLCKSGVGQPHQSVDSCTHLMCSSL